ncbi:MAG: hypothetical protein U5R30_14755 [Deltaproteobacteria bacterium]|nr:hypothetical protein [Deltaproteobacteria bacterium]
MSVSQVSRVLRSIIEGLVALAADDRVFAQKIDLVVDQIFSGLDEVAVEREHHQHVIGELFGKTGDQVIEQTVAAVDEQRFVFGQQGPPSIVLENGLVDIEFIFEQVAGAGNAVDIAGEIGGPGQILVERKSSRKLPQLRQVISQDLIEKGRVEP